jgi:Glyoxalase-like domain
MSLQYVVGVDHVVVMVEDLDAASDNWRRLGFTVSPRGTHSAKLGSGNYTIMFGDDYVELLGILSGSPSPRPMLPPALESCARSAWKRSARLILDVPSNCPAAAKARLASAFSSGRARKRLRASASALHAGQGVDPGIAAPRQHCGRAAAGDRHLTAAGK